MASIKVQSNVITSFQVKEDAPILHKERMKKVTDGESFTVYNNFLQEVAGEVFDGPIYTNGDEWGCVLVHDNGLSYCIPSWLLLLEEVNKTNYETLN